MSNAAELGALLYEAEASFGEDVTTFATHRLPLLDAVDCSGLTHDKLDPQRVVQYLQEGTPHIIGVQGGSFKIRMHAHGHGSSTSGALSTDPIETFLGTFVFGKLTQSAASGTTASGGTASAPTTVASATFTAGALCRIGALGDARGNGQAAAISTHVTTTLSLLTAIDASPSNGDVIYTGVNLYLPESANDASTSITGFRALLATWNLRYECHGCYVKSLKLGGTGHTQTPYWEIEIGVSWWRPSTAGAMPSTVTQNAYNPAPNASGSMFLNDVGTATRAKRTFRDLTIDIELGIVPLFGPGGVNQYQSTVGAKRVPSKIKVGWTEDADAATATPTLDGFWSATAKKHMLVTLNPTNGASLAIYFPQLCITGRRPVQMATDRINRMRIEAMAYTGPTNTSELTLSAMRVLYS